MVIPVPAHTEYKFGQFKWPSGPATLHTNHSERFIIEHLRDSLLSRCKIASNVVPVADDTPTVALLIEDAVPELEGQSFKDEGYTLCVAESGIVIRAVAAAGLFYGVQSLLQLLPWKDEPCASTRSLACMQISDYPQYRWRGTLLDVGRHMFSVAFIKKFLDVLALHKINRFHWHLTEDQGWRIEIKQLPRLTEIGAFRGTGDERYGGFYTQEEVIEVVSYAASRFIEVIPEIELPGHCKAALACYPDLSCTGDVTEVPTQWGVQTDVYCAGKEETFRFLETVLEEVVTIFPSHYFHIGGDECPKTRWCECKLCQQRISDESLQDENALQTWFIMRIARFLEERGRQIIGWDEILEGGIPSNAIVMSWRGTSGGVLAAKQKHNVIMCPNNRCYLDYRQSANIQEPGTWYAVLPIEWVYTFEPRGALGCGHNITPVTPGSSSSALACSSVQGVEEERPSLSQSADMPTDAAPEPHPASSKDAADIEIDGISQGLTIPSMSHDMSIADGSTGSDHSVLDPEVSAQMETDSRKSACTPSIAGGLADNTAAENEPRTSECDEAATVPGVSDFIRDQYMYKLTPEDEQFIIGGQANLWTEFISDEATAEYMLLPRLCAFAECVWSPPENKNWRDFTERTQQMLDNLRTAGYNFRPLSVMSDAES